MKKFFFSLLLLLSSLGAVWATRLSGEVKFTYYGSENPMGSGTVSLNQNGKVVYQTMIVNSYDSELSRSVARYAFDDVQDGSYTLVMYGQGYGKVWSYTQEVRVDATDLVLDIMGVEDPSKVFMTVTTRVGPSSYTPVEGVEVTCALADESSEGQTDANGTVSFLCDTLSLYTLSFHKDGYKDTSFQTKAAEYNIYSGTMNPKYIVVYLTEDLGDQVSVSGTLKLEGSEELITLSGLQLGILSSKGKQYTSHVIDGEYAYPSVSTGQATFFIYDNQVGAASRDYAIVTPQDGKVDLVDQGEGNFVQDVVFKRTAATITGRLLDAATSQPIRTQAKVYIEGLTDTAVSDYSGKFSIGGVPEGSHDLHISAPGMESLEEKVDVRFSDLAVGDKIDLGDRSMDAIAVDITFFGRLYYYNQSYDVVYVDNARVELLSADGATPIDTAFTDADGNFEIVCKGFLNTYYQIRVTHEDIEDASATINASSNRVDVSGQLYLRMRLPDIYPAQDAAAVKIKGKEEVLITWDYHPDVKAGLGDTYVISNVAIYRKSSMAEAYGQRIGAVVVDSDVLPTRYTDTTVKFDSVYFYQIEIQYRQPSSSSMYTDWNDSVMVEVADYYELALVSNIEAAGSVKGAGSYKSGTKVEISAQASEGFSFVAFVSGPDTLSKETPYSFGIVSDTSITAVFKEDEIPVPDTVFYTVNLNANPSNGGKVSGAGKYEEGQKVSIKAEANSGYRFVAWMSGNDTVGSEAELSFTLVCDTTLTAHFEQVTGIEQADLSSWNCYVENGEVVIVSQTTGGEYQVYNVEGKLLGRGKVVSEIQTVPVDGSGVLIILYRNQLEWSVRKVVRI